MDIIDLLANVLIVLLVIYNVTIGYISIKDWIRKNWRG